MTLAAVTSLSEGAIENPAKLSFAWWEITGKCQLACTHCYASSSPSGAHGTMTVSDWKRVIDQTYELGATLGQFIGGEPTQHPNFLELAQYALTRGKIEVYTNLVSVTDALWALYTTPGVQVATSYYSTDPAEHARIVGGAANAHRLTTANIEEAINRGVTLRVGMIDIEEGQHVADARAWLESVGVTDIGYDKLREVGRGVRTQTADASQLCGQCTSDNVAIAPDGAVWPCVFSRWLPVGNVLEGSLTAILTGQAMASAVKTLDAEFAQRMTCPHGGDHTDACAPNVCSPDYCNPRIGCKPTRSDMRLSVGCNPDPCAPAVCRPTIS